MKTKGKNDHAATAVVFRPVTELPLDIDRLAEQARAEGFNFIDRLVADFHQGVNRFDQSGEVLFVGCSGSHTVAVGGLNRDPLGQSHVGRLRRVYVLSSMRGKAVAQAMLTHLQAFARGHYTELQLFTDNPQAARFYEREGYERRSEARVSHSLRL